MAFFLLHLGLDGHGGMRHNHETLFWDELAGDATDAIGLVLNADKGGIEVFDEFLLACCQTRIFLFGEHITAFFKCFECRRGVGYVVFSAGHGLIEQFKAVDGFLAFL